MARAGGKVILLGEHAVVYGGAAIAVGIQRGAHATADPARVSTITLGELSATAGDGSDLGAALDALLGSIGGPPLAVSVSLDLPPGVGLGASAAVGVAVARAALDATRSPAGSPTAAAAERSRLELAAATEWERVFHGNPSGIDTWSAAIGGCLSFSRAAGATPVALGAPLDLAIAIAGPPASTRQMVEAVARLKQRSPALVEDVLEQIGALVQEAQAAVTKGDRHRLGRLLDQNQELLARLLVSTDGIERACQWARDAGALGAKLTGSGGGGAVVALVDAGMADVLAAWRDHGLDCFCTSVGPPANAGPAPGQATERP